MNMKTMLRVALAAALAAGGLTGCMTVKEGRAGRTHAHRARAGRPGPQRHHRLPPRPAPSEAAPSEAAPVAPGR